MLNFLRKIISYDNPLRRLWHLLKGLIAAMMYGFPGRQMVCIGVTGTNGKTTTTHMVEQVLHVAGKKVAMISTAEFSIMGKHEVNESKKTTLSPFKTQKFLKKCLEAGVEYVVIESSSHALHQFRLWGIPFSVAAITNITHEHLDYHGTMKKYAAAKRMLFESVSTTAHRKISERMKRIPHQQASILNVADEFYPSFKKVSCPVQIEYGLGKGELQAKGMEYFKTGSSFVLNWEGQTMNIHLKLTGSFNVENALAATGVGLACELSLEEIKKGLERFESVPGRMERIKSPKGFEVVVDFALTPDALERLYSELRKTTEGRLIGLIGSCGDRDKEKRPEMGRIVASHCDLTIVTDEEPYSEDPMVIMLAVLEGAKRVKTMGEDLLLIEDRKKAMEHAIKYAQKGDVVVVTGMGSFQTRTMNDGPMKWDERDVARELIENHNK